MAHQLHPSILREYDIRGITDETLSVDDAFAIGKAFATIVLRGGGKQIACAWDARLSSPSFATACTDGMQSTGANVISLSIGPTPMLYFAVRFMELDGGIMITGSHNPPEHNGFKMMLGKQSFYGKDIKKLGQMITADDFLEGEGTITEHNIKQDYVNTLADAFNDDMTATLPKVAWDAGNGAAGEIMQMLTQQLAGEHVLLCEQMDGSFPNHHPDPTVPENLKMLIDTVRQEGCDLGVAFDGDGDRIGVVDNTGNILWGDQFMIVLAKEVLQKHPGAPIIADVKASKTLFDAIARMGGQPIMWKTGHSLVKTKMAETGAPLAGEMSGHIFFADEYYGYDDGLYAAVRLINMLAHSNQTLEEIMRNIPKMHSTPEMRIPCDESQKFSMITEMKTRLDAAGIQADDTDGMRVTTEHGWWLLRASNTQAVLVARAEAETPEHLQELKTMLSEQLAPYGLLLPKD